MHFLLCCHPDRSTSGVEGSLAFELIILQTNPQKQYRETYLIYLNLDKITSMLSAHTYGGF